MADLNSVLIVRAVGTGDDQTYTMLRRCSVFDVCVLATNGGAGTVTLQNGANAISAAIDPSSTDTAYIRPVTGGVWTAAQRDLAIGDVLTFNVSAGTLNYEAYAYLYPNPGVPE